MTAYRTGNKKSSTNEKIKIVIYFVATWKINKSKYKTKSVYLSVSLQRMEMRRNNGRTERKVSRQLKSVRSVWEWCLHVVAHVNSLWFSFLWHCSSFWFDHCIVHVCTIIVVASFMSRIKTEYVYRRHSSLTIQWMLEAQRALYYHMAVFDSFGLFQSHFYHLFGILTNCEDGTTKTTMHVDSDWNLYADTNSNFVLPAKKGNEFQMTILGPRTWKISYLSFFSLAAAENQIPFWNLQIFQSVKFFLSGRNFVLLMQFQLIYEIVHHSLLMNFQFHFSMNGNSFSYATLFDKITLRMPFDECKHKNGMLFNVQRV